MDQGKNMIITLVLPFILFYVSKIIFKNNYFRIKFMKVWLTLFSLARPGFSSLNEASTSKCSNSTLIGQANMEDLEAAPTKSICICTSLGGWKWLSQNSSLTSLIISSRLLYGLEDCTFLQYLLVSHLACVEPWL